MAWLSSLCNGKCRQSHSTVIFFLHYLSACANISVYGISILRTEINTHILNSCHTITTLQYILHVINLRICVSQFHTINQQLLATHQLR